MAQLAQMFGLGTHLGHLTSSGTIANLEALFVARELHPDRGIAYSTEAHYTHGRMCGVLGIDGHPGGHGRRGPDGPRRAGRAARRGQDRHRGGDRGHDWRRRHRSGARGLAIARQHGVRVHVDAAYGGFFTLLAGLEDRAGLDAAPWRAIAECDSVVVDPHKHGLQPYGCGAVLFARPGRRAVLPARLALHLLHVRRPAPRRDQPRVLAGPGRRPPRCGSRSGCCRPRRTGSAGCSRPAAGPPWTWPS